MYDVEHDRFGGILITRTRDGASVYLQPGDDAAAFQDNPADYDPCMIGCGDAYRDDPFGTYV